MVRRSGFGVPFSTVSPNSFAKARTSAIAAGSAACCWRYCVRVRRSRPRRLVLSGFLRRTTTETVKTLLGRAGFSLVAADRGAFSLPVSTTRCWEEKREEEVLAAMGEFSEVRTHHIPLYVSKEVTSGIQVLGPPYNIACNAEERNASRMSGAMPTSLDWPLKNPQRRRRRFFILLALVALIVFGGRTAVSYFVDLLWFRSLGYGSVFSKTLVLQWSIFALFSAATFFILYATFAALKRAHLPDLPSSHTIFFGGQPIKLPVEPVMQLLAFGGSIVIALVTGAGMMAEWPTLALFWYAPRGMGGVPGAVIDPIFSKPVSFFLFTLPTWQLISGWLLTLAVITCVLAIFFILITGGAGALAGRRSYLTVSWRGLSITFAFLLLILAIRVYLGRFDLLFDDHTVFGGVTYTDAHITLTGLVLVSVALLAGAIACAANAMTVARGRWLVAAILPAVLCFAGVRVAGWWMSSFIVKPNELVREQPYIAHNILMTRQAYGLDRFSQREFPAETTVGAADPANNQPTLQNIRLWDWQALQDTLRQIQEIRTYYDFPDIDIDRYEIDGTLRQVMLATRELNVEKLPESSRNWINEKLIYTHGYGITMNPVNGFTPEGLPTLYLSNMPVQSTVPGLNVTRPEIYFGELTNTDVYVKTRQQEFNYPQGQTNNLTSYQGNGGIVVGVLLRRVLLAIDRGYLGKLPFSDDVNSQSRMLLWRNIRQRVAK